MIHWKQINAVDALVHGSAAAVKFEGAAPTDRTPAGKILRRAQPVELHVGVEDASQTARSNGLFHFGIERMEARLKDRRQLHVVIAACRDERVGLLKGYVQRLLANHVLAGLCDLDTQIGVGAGGRANVNHLHRIVGQELRHGTVGRDVMLPREAHGELRLHIGDADQLRTRGVLDRLRVGTGYAPGANHAKANVLLCRHLVPSSFCSLTFSILRPALANIGGQCVHTTCYPLTHLDLLSGASTLRQA